MPDAADRRQVAVDPAADPRQAWAILCAIGIGGARRILEP
jgi:hypothetical protein